MTTDQLSGLANNLAYTAVDVADRAGSTISYVVALSVRREAGTIKEKVYNAGARATQYAKSTVIQPPMLSLIGIAAIGFATSFSICSLSSPFASNV